MLCHKPPFPYCLYLIMFTYLPSLIESCRYLHLQLLDYTFWKMGLSQIKLLKGCNILNGGFNVSVSIYDHLPCIRVGV